MAFQQIPGGGLRIGYDQILLIPPTFANSTIAASADLFAICGRLWWPDRGTHNITKVHTMLGTISSTHGSSVRASIQGVSHSAAPIQPDGNIAGSGTATVTFNINTMTSSTWFTSPALGTTLSSQQHGTELSVVFDYPGTPNAYTSGDSMIFASLSGSSSGYNPLSGNPTTYLSGTHAVVTGFGNLIIEADDGTFGTIEGCLACTTVTSKTLNTGTNPSEIALPFQLPFPFVTDGFILPVSMTASGTLSVKLYDGTTVMTNGSVTIDPHAVSSTGSGRPAYMPWPAEITCLANHVYRLTVSPTTANSVTAYYFNVNAAAHLAVHPGGVNWNYDSRNGGAWIGGGTTNRLIAGISFSKMDDGAGSGASGGFIIGGM